MKDPKPTFAHFVSTIKQRYPELSYLHAIEPRVAGDEDGESSEAESNDFLREIWKPKPFISAGNYSRESAMKTADKTGDLIAFGRLFISNVSVLLFRVSFLTFLTQPDLPLRLQKGVDLTKPDRSSFYIRESPKGYVDYPFTKL